MSTPRSTPDPAAWFPAGVSASHPGPRLFCLPFGGGSAAIYQHWGPALRREVDVVPIELPGRGTRFREPAFDRVSDCIDALVPAIAPLLDRPYVVFGHSMGALLTFELAQALRTRGLRPAHTLIVSGRHAPHLPARTRDIHRLPDEELVTELRRLNGTPEEVLADRGLLSLVLPTLRSDCALCETYQYRRSPPLEVPIVAVGGDADPDVPREDLAAWAEHSIAGAEAITLPGDHFYLHTSESALLTLVAQVCRSAR